MTRPHNPDNYPTNVVGDGYRLLDEDEIVDPVRPTAERFAEVECYLKGEWLAGWNGDGVTLTYRTKLTREELRARRGLVVT
jgi:hypothetical protein